MNFFNIPNIFQLEDLKKLCGLNLQNIIVNALTYTNTQCQTRLLHNIVDREKDQKMHLNFF
jgi:hypothetical protein